MAYTARVRISVMLLCAVCITGDVASQQKRRARGSVCQAHPLEHRFTELIDSLFEERFINEGAIVDCGAHTGHEACRYASLRPNSIVHAIEPMRSNLAALNASYAHLRNIHPLHGGLGSVERMVDMAPRKLRTGKKITMLEDVQLAPAANQSSATTFRVHRLDNLFAAQWPSQRLVFAHFDVEGAELDVLAGATDTIRRDRPIFTVELKLGNTDYNAKLFGAVRGLGYDAFVVPERCGVPYDCRNAICLPVERQPTAALSAGTVRVQRWHPLETLDRIWRASAKNGTLVKWPVAVDECPKQASSNHPCCRPNATEYLCRAL